MATTFKGQAVLWGTTSANFENTGICVSASTNKTASTDPVENEDGAMTGMVFYDEKYSITATVVCKDATALPENGDAISIGGLSCYVTNVVKNWTNNGKVQFTVTAEGGANMSSPGGGSGA